MTPFKVSFHGLELDPNDLIDRVEYGVIPGEWHRYRFRSLAPIRDLNRWLADNVEGRWAIYATRWQRERTVTIAFENSCDASIFVLADGKNQCQILDE